MRAWIIGLAVALSACGGEVGYDPLTVRASVHYETEGVCDGAGFALVVYPYSDSRLPSTPDPLGVDDGLVGEALELQLSATAVGPRTRAILRELTGSSRPTTVTPVGDLETACDGLVQLRLDIHPYAPAGPAGVTRYVVDPEGLDFEAVGADLYPGDQIRVGIVGAAATAPLRVDLFSVSSAGSCPE